MAKYNGPVCKLCRRENEKLFLKGERCLSNKCTLDKKSYPPGQHGKTRRIKLSDYGIQLREKQKMRRYYGLLESQFRNVYEKANKKKGITGDNMLQMLESRLDNVVFRLGFAPSRSAARQLVRHRHVMLNGYIADIPSMQIQPGDSIHIHDKSRKLESIHQSLRKMKESQQMPWLQVDKAKLTGTLLETPNRADIPVKFNESLVVELYSK